MARDREHRLRVQLDHRARVILAVDGEEIQQLAHMVLALIKIPLVPGRLRDEVIRELLEDRQRPRGIEVKDIRVLLAVSIPRRVGEKAGILRAERRLHVERGRRHIREHEHRRPLRDRHARRELADRERDGPLVLPDGLRHAIERLLRLVLVVEPAVARREDDLIVLEHRMQPELLRESLCARDSIQQPERML